MLTHMLDYDYDGATSYAGIPVSAEQPGVVVLNLADFSQCDIGIICIADATSSVRV